MSNEISVIEQCEVSPPPGSLPSTIDLPLTFFDIPWFSAYPNQRIFFYQFPYSTQHFLQTTLPILKHSLSLSLKNFFPFVSNLIVPQNYFPFPYIRYLPNDSLSFTIAESPADFNILVSHSQHAKNWHPLVPNLPPPRTENDDTRVIPLMAIQVTLFPNSGFSIGLTFNHLAGDGNSLHQFIKYWAFLSKSKPNLTITSTLTLLQESTISLIPSHERDLVIKDPKGLKLVYLQQLQDSVSQNMELPAELVRNLYADKLRNTFVLSREQAEKIKNWVKVKSSVLCHVSTFVVTSSLIWVSMIKSEKSKDGDDDELCYLMFYGDCRDHPQLSIPSNYFGNCVASIIVGVKRGELVGKNGMVVATNAIEKKVRDFKVDALRGAETSISDFKEIVKSVKSSLVGVLGSPKHAVYETDFGWGKPIKSGVVHIDLFGAISLSQSRDRDSGIEVGLALEWNQMTDFVSILEEQLQNICSM